MKGRAWLIRIFVIFVSITGAISLVGCIPDPYEQCMKEEKRRNAYLGEDEYLKKSSKICARKVRQAQ